MWCDIIKVMNPFPKYRIGLDVGSTTIKTAVLDENDTLVYSSYERHLSDIKATLFKVLEKVFSKFDSFSIVATGSGGLSVSSWLGIPFLQEVVAGTNAIEKYIPETDVAIELGGEDAKITYLTGGLEQRMNGTCAGGTGAFIDQMASLLATDASGLNEMAQRAEMIYPIASRCGVFAKSDIQPLINDGAKKSDIAASIFQSVVNQTISGLACGKPIRGTVAFLGGPLHFLPELKKRFVETLSPENVVAPENSQVFNALGAAINGNEIFTSSGLKKKLDELSNITSKEVERLAPLFQTEFEEETFFARHKKTAVKRSDIQKHKGATFLGIDAGSTTTKVALINNNGELLYSYYNTNEGNPLKSVISSINEIYSLLPEGSFIARSCVTGYGEHLIKAAIGVDEGEIETVAHQTASEKILPGVEFILDIGGQDMKCLKIKDGVIYDVLLNEACSSGCGSFIETFANALSISAKDFAKKGIEALEPVDLGSRCTVFMNSRVKQAQKEGATVSDISAGLAYSVVKNALFKVIRLRDFNDLGEKVIVQGGTFLNDSVLRAFEKLTGKEVVRPDIAGLMGAYGASLISQKNYVTNEKSNLKSKSELENFNIKKSSEHCKLCPNNCLLTVSTFSDGRNFITNNRCEKGAQSSEGDLPNSDSTSKPINVYDQKYRRLFSHYKPLKKEDAPRGVVGIPRVLNLYENYPFWFTFFTNLGYSVMLSPRSSREIFDMGIETMPSESVCYPAKLVHGHVEALIKKGANFIFYPAIPYEIQEDKCSDNHYNCPVVSTYPEVIRNNMTFEKGVKFMSPFLPYNSKKHMEKRLMEEFPTIAKNDIKKAVTAAYAEDENFKNDVRKMGEKALEHIKNTNGHGIVLAGRPYHIDPEINHGIPEMIENYGFTVLTEDCISHLANLERPIRVVDQWMYHSRLYKSASLVRERNDLDIIQLNSFGCGLDAVTCDQVQELIEEAGKIYTTLKIDEVNNLGAARIRVRSLMAVLNRRKQKNILAKKDLPKTKSRVLFTKEMRKSYTIIAPEISPIHLRVLKHSMQKYNLNLDVLEDSPQTIEMGLKYVHNDACYPTIITIGSIMDALLSGRYNLDNTAVMITQTGGGCRATNYIAMLRLALKKAKIDHVPVISLNFAGLEKNPGFKVTLPMIKDLVKSLLYGDLFMRVLYRTRPYEVEKGSANALYEKWNEIVSEGLKVGKDNFKKNSKKIVEEFNALPVHDIAKPRVGIVGEILVKYHPLANNYAIDLLEKEGCEVVVPDMLDFFLYGFYNNTIKYELLSNTYLQKLIGDVYIWYIEKLKKPMLDALDETKFGKPVHIKKMAKMAEEIVSLGNISGEGWFLTAEMIELIHSGVNNIICMQPFACLPNHVTGKGVMKTLKSKFPKANIVPVDYDPGASEVNQINRIKLMLSTAFKDIKK